MKRSLILFFTKDNSLKNWYETGILDREVALYRRLQERGYQISFVTYGDSSDLAYQDSMPGISILCNRWHLPYRLYVAIIPLLFGFSFLKAHVFKTNQTKGAEIALRAARIWKKPLISRCGYPLSEFMIREHGEDSEAARYAFALEAKVFPTADRLFVTSPTMKEDICRRFPQITDRICLIPNYVETDKFMPMRDMEKVFDLVFVGRFTQQKNIENLLTALQLTDYRLLLIGSGVLQKTLYNRFGTLDGRIHWKENVPNTQLPYYLNQGRVFILPSFYEGHPKVLLEAMACGLPVIGTDVPGIANIIQHKENGWKCHTDAESIRQAMKILLDSPGLQQKLGKKARRDIEDHFSLNRVVEMEYQNIEGLFSKGNPCVS